MIDEGNVSILSIRFDSVTLLIYERTEIGLIK